MLGLLVGVLLGLAIHRHRARTAFSTAAPQHHHSGTAAARHELGRSSLSQRVCAEPPVRPTLSRFLVRHAVMMGSGVFLASYATTLLQFVLSYSVLFGLGVGLAYQMPFITGGRWFPAAKGTMQGAIISGMGASAFIFNLVATRFINPYGKNMVDGAFPADVTARWPALLRNCSVLRASVPYRANSPTSPSPSF